MKTTRRSPAAAMLRLSATVLASLSLSLSPSLSLSAASSEPSSSSSSFLNRYVPIADVDDVAHLDLDVGVIVDRLALGGEFGLSSAKDVYVDGRGGKKESDVAANNNGNSNNATTVGWTIGSLGANLGEYYIPRANNGSTTTAMGAASDTYDLFENYFGADDYADRWIRTSFDGEFAFRFQDLGVEGRIAFVRYGTVALTIWINVIGRIETAAKLCPTLPPDDALLLWDRAVAFYVGSLARANGGHDGHFVYALAQVQCAAFGTCSSGEEGTGAAIAMAPNNDRILDAFEDGRARLMRGDCEGATWKAANVRSLAIVPLIQGTLGAAHALEHGDAKDATRGEGLAFGASILPLLNECDAGDAGIVRDHLVDGGLSSIGSSRAVRAALERGYHCLGITCAEVGGILNSRGDGYVPGAGACIHPGVRPVGSGVSQDDASDEEVDDDSLEYEDYSHPNEPELPSVPHSDPKNQPSPKPGRFRPFEGVDSTNAALLSGLVFGIIGFLLGAVIAAVCKSRKQKKEQSGVEFVTATDENRSVDENDAGASSEGSLADCYDATRERLMLV